MTEKIVEIVAAYREQCDLHGDDYVTQKLLRAMRDRYEKTGLRSTEAGRAIVQLLRETDLPCPL